MKFILLPLVLLVRMTIGILLLPILPLYFIFMILFFPNAQNGFFSFRTKFQRLVALFLIFFIQIPLWIMLYFILGTIVFNQIGLIEEHIPISGTGSMYPTFPKGDDGKSPFELSQQIVGTPGMLRYPNGLMLFGARYFSHALAKKDIVVFENPAVRAMTQKKYGSSAGLVKRVIALAGDVVQLRGGQVIVNGEIIDEPYIAQARSTFGGTTISDCKEIRVPDGAAFVLGDNRKVSNDSRHDVGFIKTTDISYVLPFEKQIGSVDMLWRNTAWDNQESSKIVLDKQLFLKLLNQKRNEAGVSPVRYDKKLEQSATLRTERILQTNDFSTEATISGFTMKQAMRSVGYNNTIWGETVVQGHYEAQELLDNMFEFANNKSFLLDDEYDDIGIAEKETDVLSCPTQAIVIQFAGFKPPNYSQEVVESWTKALESLKEIRPSWEQVKNNQQFYDSHKTDIDRIIVIIYQRIEHLQTIVEKMKSNQWLSDDEQAYTKLDADLAREQDNLAIKLNNSQ